MSECVDTTKKWLSELDFILDNYLIDEVGITLDVSLSPIFHTEGKLGISKSILKPLFKFGLDSIYNLKINDNCNGEVYREALSISRLVLLIKGDFPIAFDLRKRLICINALEIRDEISFTSLLYTRHPKCPSGWHHRRWCLQRNMKSNNVVLTPAEVETERELCRLLAEKYPKNYFAWMHRLWVMTYMSKFQLEDELFFTKMWLQSHVSDHSAVSHRLQVVRLVLIQPDSLSYIVSNEENMLSCAELSPWVAFLERQFLESEQLIRSRPGHEALWYLRRSLLEMFFDTVSRLHNECDLALLGKCVVSVEVVNLLLHSPPPLADSDSPDHAAGHTSFFILASLLSTSLSSAQPTSSLAWLTALLSSEMRLVRQCIADTSAWDYPAQRAMATRYAAFLLDRAAHYTTRCGSKEVIGEARVSENAGTLDQALAHALREVSATLQAEDLFARIWGYKASVNT